MWRETYLAPFSSLPFRWTGPTLTIGDVCGFILFVAEPYRYFTLWLKQRTVVVIPKLVARDGPGLGPGCPACNGTRAPVRSSPLVPESRKGKKGQKKFRHVGN